MLSRPSAAQKHQRLSLVATINVHVTHMVELQRSTMWFYYDLNLNKC
jgi:hypothetical protein